MTDMPNGPVLADLEGSELTSLDRDLLDHPKLGGITLFSRNYRSANQLEDLVAAVRERRPSLLIAVDHEGGRVQRFREGFTRLPCMQVLGQLVAREGEQALSLVRDCGWLMASELIAFDIDHSYAPVLDLDTDRSKVIGDRAFADDPDVVIALASAFIDGMQSAGMQACGKHFPGHGGVVEDSHLELPEDQRSLDEVLQRDALPFGALSGKLGAVMTAHIRFPNVDSHVVSFSSRWIREVLRERLGFEGLVLSDDLSMKGALGLGDYGVTARTALAAGCDAVLICNQPLHALAMLNALDKANEGEHGVLEALRHQAPDIGVDLEKMQRVQSDIQNLTEGAK